MTNEIQFDERAVAFMNRDDALIFMVAKTTNPYKPFALQPERDKGGKETGWYTVPRSLVFAFRAEKLADGSRLSVQRTRAIPRPDREALFKAGSEKGLKIRPLEAEKATREHPTALTLETLLSKASQL